ncbi:MAG: methyltransferase domain-containing protein [Deltaproteobacteria bacterium]|nr:methyltransferase domain-containing protein [Deltaproteobacteria bacterium]
MSSQPEWTPRGVMAMSRDVWTFCALMAGARLNLFTSLDGAGKTVAELAAAVGGEPRATGMLATALVSVGLLKRNGDLLELTPEGAKYFSAKSPDYFGNMLVHQSHILPGWLRLDESVRTGKRVASATAAESGDEVRRDAFLMAMHNGARLQARLVSEALAPRLEGRGSLLDLGGGPGTYAAEFCGRHPGLRGTVFDLPGSEKVAGRVLKMLGLEDRVAFVPGDYRTAPLPEGHDFVWVSQVLHQEDPAQAAALIKKAAAALPGGGMLVVQEFLLDDALDGPPSSALFALNMLVNTPGGQAYTFGEMAGILQSAGLADVGRIPAKLPPGCSLMGGVKP